MNSDFPSSTSITPSSFWRQGWYWLSPLLAGYFYCLGFPDINGHSFFGGTLVAMICLFSLDNWEGEGSCKRFLMRWFLFFLSSNFFGYAWLSYTLQEFGGYNEVVAKILAAAFFLIIFPQYYPYLLLKKMLNWKKGRFRWQQKIQSVLSTESQGKNLILALFFVACELWIPQQFPGHVGHPWLTLAPFLGMAPVVGAIGFSFFTYLAALSFVSHFKSKKIPFTSYALILIFIFLNLLFPLPKSLHNREQQLKVRIVQANIGNMLKLQSERGYHLAVDAVLSGYERLSLQGPPTDLVIWPETSYPKFISAQAPEDMANYHPRLSRFLQQLQTPLFFGGYIEIPWEEGQNISENFEDVYNSAIYINPNLKIEATYHKQKLIPFGETLPFPRLINQWLAKHLPAVSFFASGKIPMTFHFKHNFKANALVCYEVLFSSLVRDQLNKLDLAPDFMINLTNDSWYGPTSEPHQHKFLAHWRALEFQAPVIRSTNTGITSVLYSDGEESEQLKWNELRALDISMSKRSTDVATLFQRFGHWPLFIGAFILGLFFLARDREKVHDA